MFIEHDLPGTWRDEPFIPGCQYCVLQSAPSWEGQLSPDEVLTYYGATYSHYDGCTVYVFTTGQGKERTWLLRDDEPTESWSRVFSNT
jgi:hypothetical protein